MKKIVTVKGTIAVAWCWTHDTSEDRPKILHDLVNGARLIAGHVTFPLDVTGSDVWVLTRDVGTGNHVLTRYYQDGRQHTLSTLPGELREAFRPLSGMPANVWARAVAEEHDLACKGRRGGCGCTEARRKLSEDGLLG